MATITATVLGCGSSGGVPRFGGDWGDCDPKNPKNNRLRCSLLVERKGQCGSTRTCIDAGPDFRQQILAANVPMLDALVLSHEHADHIHGIDDMRQFVNMKTAQIMSERGYEQNRENYLIAVKEARIDCFAGLTCFEQMQTRFDYLFVQFKNSLYPPIMHLKPITDTFEINGAGGAIPLTPFAVPHGSIEAYGFRIGGLVYMPDVQNINDTAREIIRDCDVLVVDCLQFRAHGTHAHFDLTMEWIKELTPKRAILTNLHNSMDYNHINSITPDHVSPAFDGMQIEFTL